MTLRKHILTLLLVGGFAVLGAGTTSSSDEEGASGEEDEAEGELVSCDLSETVGRICTEYRVGEDGMSRELLEETCRGNQILTPEPERVGLTEGPCPTEGLIARCDPAFGSVKNYTYHDPDPSVDEEAALTMSETLCTGTFTRM